jgi:hypothetical protein
MIHGSPSTPTTSAARTSPPVAINQRWRGATARLGIAGTVGVVMGYVSGILRRDT